MKDDKHQKDLLNDREAETNYQFLNQVIREKPSKRPAWLLRIAGILLGAVLFGTAAAAVFLFSVRFASGAMGIDLTNPRISIPEDESASVISGGTDYLSGAPLENSGPAVGESGDEDTAENEENKEDEERIDSLNAYREVFRNMLQVADESEQAIVQVTGITNEMDYFHQNYENLRQISGLAVAVSDESVYILTEYRVIDKASRIMVTFHDGSIADAEFQKRDPDTGLTILTVPVDCVKEGTLNILQAASLGNSRAVERGEPILALGSPLGYGDSVAYGIVTATENTVSGIDAQYSLLTTDIEGSRDGSGILVNLDGQVVGIIAQQYAGNNHTITALAISRIKPLIEKLSNNEILPWIGITGQNVTQELSGETGIPRGVLVTSVEPDSPAMLSGIKEYDVIVKINEMPVYRVQEYQKIVEGLKPEEELSVIAMRKGAGGYREISFPVVCGEK